MEMNDFLYVDAFLSVDEEKTIIDNLMNSDVQWKRINSRRITHFGLRYDYPRFAVVHSSDIPPFPEYLSPMISRLYQLLQQNGIKLPDNYFNQMTIQQYPPKTGISPHVDTTEYFGEYIASVSLVTLIYNRNEIDL